MPRPLRSSFYPPGTRSLPPAAGPAPAPRGVADANSSPEARQIVTAAQVPTAWPPIPARVRRRAVDAPRGHVIGRFLTPQGRLLFELIDHGQRPDMHGTSPFAAR